MQLSFHIYQSFGQNTLQWNAEINLSKRDKDLGFGLGSWNKRDKKMINCTNCDWEEVKTFAKCQAFTFEKW